jgi:hypothetical protein
VASDCANNACIGNVCVPPPNGSCANGIKDGAETDIDCGGPACPKCVLGKQCAVNADCQSNVCTAGVCQP